MPCPHCGNNPINHQSVWLFGSLDIWLMPLRQRIFYSWFGRSVVDPLSDLLGSILFNALKLAGLIRLNRDLERIPYQRARCLWTEAKNRGIDIVEIKPFGLSIDCYEAPIQGQRTRFFGLPRPSAIDEAVLDWIDDKWIMKQKLIAAHLPVSRGASIRNFKQAQECFHALTQPVVIKPRKGSRNRHTTVLVSTEAQLAEAFHIAKQLCHYVIIEEYLWGDIYRGTVINHQLAGVYGIASPKVTGNGRDPIHRIIETYNQKLPAGRIAIAITGAHQDHLSRQNLHLDSVLAPGQTVTLLPKAGVNYGGTSYDCTDSAHEDTKQMLLQAATVVGDPILGFDFIVPDIAKSYKEQKCGIIECNGAPFINLHYDPLYGPTRPAAKYVWDLVA